MAEPFGIESQTPVTTAAVDRAGGQPTPEQAERLRVLAAEFESLLLSQMLKTMQSSFLGEDESTGFGSNPLAESVFSELSLALSRAGGIGIADTLMAPMMRQVVPGAEAAGFAGPSVELPTLSIENFGGRVSSEFGWRHDPIDGSNRFHAGTDIALPVGHDVPAARAGRVSFAGELPGYGLTVVVDHDNQLATRYAHLSKIDVEVGRRVAAGQSIAESGATGRVTGPHLHFEVLEAGTPVDPEVLSQTASQFGQKP